MPLHVANQPHQSPSRQCVTERNDVFGTVQCVQRNQISLRNRQLASINTVYIFLYIYSQLSINFPKLSHIHLSLLSLSLSLSLSLQQLLTSNILSAHVRRAAPPIRRRSLYVASQTQCQSPSTATQRRRNSNQHSGVLAVTITSYRTYAPQHASPAQDCPRVALLDCPRIDVCIIASIRLLCYYTDVHGPRDGKLNLGTSGGLESSDFALAKLKSSRK